MITWSTNNTVKIFSIVLKGFHVGKIFEDDKLEQYLSNFFTRCLSYFKRTKNECKTFNWLHFRIIFKGSKNAKISFSFDRFYDYKASITKLKNLNPSSFR